MYRSYAVLRSRRFSMLSHILRSKDPSVYTVLMEDSADLLEITAAFLGVYLGHTLDAPWLDGAASVFIGLILALVAVFLAFQTRGLLLGEAVDSEAVRRIRSVVEADPDVEQAGDLLTMYLGPHQALLNLCVRFHSPLRVEDLSAVIQRLESAIRQVNPDMRQIFIEADTLRGPAKQV